MKQNRITQRNEIKMTDKTSGRASVFAMPWALLLLWTMALLLLLESSVNNLVLVHAADKVNSFQNGRINGALYAGGMDYSPNNLYVTGITYGSSDGGHTDEARCFVSIFTRNALNQHSKTISTTLGDGTHMQTCHGVSTLHNILSNKKESLREQTPFMVAGTSEAGGEFGSGGFVAAMKQNAEESNHPVRAGHATDGEFGSHSFSYPISISYVKSPEHGETERITYVASVTAHNIAENPNNPELMKATHNQPNWMKYYKYGSSFELGLHKYIKDANEFFSLDYTKIYPVDFDEVIQSKPDVFVGGMIVKHVNGQDFLIVAGSTSGTGEAYGVAAPGTDDVDGYISVHVGATGDIRETDISTIRIGTADTDLILGICDDPNNVDEFYIVGSTGDAPGMGDPIVRGKAVVITNLGSLHGYVQKINMNTMERVWGRTWSSNRIGTDAAGEPSEEPTITAGIECKVLDDGTLYVAGIVEKGAHIKKNVKLDHDNDDVVAFRLVSDTGEVKWIKQFGSKDGDEDLAPSGAMAVDEDGNLILLGHTTGSLFRKRKKRKDNTSDIFLATLSKEDGSHDKTVPANHQGDWEFGQTDNPETGMLSGGEWKDDEIYGTGLWADKNALGIQSGPTGGSVFAGGMVYDKEEDAVYLTGIAYEGDNTDGSDILSSCMVTKVKVEQSKITGWGGANGKIIGQNDILEVCDSIALHGYSEVVAIGSADSGSTLHQGDSPMTGFAIALDRFDLEEVDATTLVGTKNPNGRIQYPIDIVSDGDDMYIVSLTSTDETKTTEFQQLMANAGRSDFSPNWINMKKYGSSFDMTVTKVTLVDEMIDGVSMGNIAFTTQWVQEFRVDSDGDNTGTIPRVFLGGAILKKSRGYLAVSGSTRGMGSAYGAATGNDEDGFVTLLDMNTGELFESAGKNNLREGTPDDDVVLGMCHDPNDDSSFYIVGGTKGKMPYAEKITDTPDGSTHAFLLKVDANSLSTMWTVQLGALHSSHGDDGEKLTPTTAKAFDCAVSGDTIYAGGVVDDGAGLVVDNMARNNRGGDDIWLGSFGTDDGKFNWVRQMGSESGNDHMAPRGGITITKDDTVLIYGDTNGEFFREHLTAGRKVNEVFLMEVDKDGKHKPYVRHHKYLETPAPAPVGSVPAPGPPGGSVPAPTPAPGPSVIVTAPPFLVNSSESSAKKNFALTSVLVVGSLGFIAVVIVVVFCLRERLRSRAEQYSVPNSKDGVMKVDNKGITKAPPSSIFGRTDDSLNVYSESLKIEDKDLI